MLKTRSILLAVALFFSLLPLAGYQVGRHRWAMLSDFPAGAIACGVLAVATWVIYFAVNRRLNARAGDARTCNRVLRRHVPLRPAHAHEPRWTTIATRAPRRR